MLAIPTLQHLFFENLQILQGKFSTIADFGTKYFAAVGIHLIILLQHVHVFVGEYVHYSCYSTYHF